MMRDGMDASHTRTTLERGVVARGRTISWWSIVTVTTERVRSARAQRLLGAPRPETVTNRKRGR